MFLVVLTAGIGIVSAETLTGDLGGTNYNQTSYVYAPGGSQTASFGNLYADKIELITVPPTMIRFDGGYPAGGTLWGATKIPAGNTTTFTAHIDTAAGAYIGSGTIGYQRNFNQAGTDIDGYQWVQFNDWNITGLTGDHYIHLTFTGLDGFNRTWQNMQYGNTPTDGTLCFAGTNGPNGAMGGSYLLTRVGEMHNLYSATKPSGVGISGYVNKTYSGTSYPSRIRLYNASGGLVAGEDTIRSGNYSFNVYADQIMISAYSGEGIFYNTSLLFTPGGLGLPTSTPTPTTTITPVPTVAPGYVRTNVHVWDRGGNMIHGANIDIKDIGNSSWTNSTHDADGISYIDTLPYHQINIYGSYDVFSNEFLPNSLLNQDTGPAGYTYYLTLFPYESGVTAGNVSLYVEVKDADSGSYIPYANVQIVLSNGYSYSGSTANLGSKVFIVPNNTQVHATGSASGYLPATVISNSGSGGSLTMTVSLHKQVVTTRPTSTIPPGGITPAITIDPRSASQKDADMMDMIRTAGPNLIQLALAVTMISLLGLMTKGFGK